MRIETIPTGSAHGQDNALLAPIIGGMTLGATMALMAQMYHISEPLHPLLLTWSFRVVVMAYCLRNADLGILSALIVLWAGGSGWTELRRFANDSTEEAILSLDLLRFLEITRTAF
ncbi:MAG: DUF2157 domain-containing protein [Alkalinema sp. CAN_BIN05]|nr:DUF2157 domain-containing protein [Alkalinema sp. CAN_BIN05]